METENQMAALTDEVKQLSQLIRHVLDDNQEIKKRCMEIKEENAILKQENADLKRRLAAISDRLHQENEREENNVVLTAMEDLGGDLAGATQKIDDLTLQKEKLLKENRELKRRLNLDPNDPVPPKPEPQKLKEDPKSQNPNPPNTPTPPKQNPRKNGNVCSIL